MIQVEHLYKSYGKSTALKDISLKFCAGQAVSLLGPNGSGKTTLIKSILGLVIPEKGEIKVHGETINDTCAYRSQIGYMPQIGRFPENMTINQVIQMIKDIRTDCCNYDDELIKEFGISSIGTKSMRSLSGGTRQKISACLAFLFSPSILILDEPTSGLDPLSSELLKEKVFREREKGKLILITSHVLSDLEGIVSDVVYLQDGSVVFNRTVEELELLTGQKKLNKVIATMMKNELQKMPEMI
jgi:Cu-processing system ATP-binding protein